MSKSPAIEAALSRCEAVTQWLDAHFPREAPASLKSHIAFAYFHLALEHRAAVVHLAASGALPSAAALVRAVYEACTRGLWAVLAANDDQLRTLMDRLPGFEKIVEGLHRATKKDPHLDGRIRLVHRAAWGPFSEYAHGGPAMLSRLIADGEIGSRFTDEDALQMLALVDHLMGVTLTAAAELAGPIPPAALTELLHLLGKHPNPRPD